MQSFLTFISQVLHVGEALHPPQGAEFSHFSSLRSYMAEEALQHPPLRQGFLTLLPQVVHVKEILQQHPLLGAEFPPGYT